MLINRIKTWLTGLAQYHNCLLCRQLSDRLLCLHCQQDLVFYDLARYDYNLRNCQRIIGGLKATNFNRLVALAEYEWPLAVMITELKFAGKSIHAKALSNLFCTIALPQKSVPEALIPMPLHNNRLATRQYNQAGLMANKIAKHHGLAYLPHALIRAKKTEAQSKLNASGRMKNIKGAFKLNQDLPYKHVALFDDVVTTGATVSSAAASILKRHPHMIIDVWTICITPEYR